MCLLSTKTKLEGKKLQTPLAKREVYQLLCHHNLLNQNFVCLDHTFIYGDLITF